MKEKIALYALGIGIVVLGSAIYGHLVDGEPIHLGRLLVVLFLGPVFGYFIWLRHDWAEPIGKRKREEKARLEAKQEHAEKK